MASPIIVEFVGVAGSGKTSISKALVDRLAARGVSVGYRPNVRKTIVRPAALRKPRAICAWTSTILRVIKAPPARREQLRKTHRLLGRIVSLALRNQVVVMDEGILHRFRAIRRASVAMDLSIAEAAKPLPLAWLFPHEPSLFVLVQCDAESIASRLHSRDGRQVHWTPSEVSRGDAQSLRDIDQVLDVFPRASKMISSNRSTQDISSRALEIASRIEQELARHRPH